MKVTDTSESFGLKVRSEGIVKVFFSSLSIISAR